MPLEYAKLYKEAYEKNVLDVSRAVKEGEFDKKIGNFCDSHGFDKEYVVEQIKTNDVVAAFFAVNPNKQNFYEKKAAAYIEDMEGVTEFRNLPNNALSVSNGAVLPRRELAALGGAPKAKTIDFQWQYGGLTFYASHKYTKEGGGTQDKAYADLQTFISECVRTTLRKTHFIAISDGDYYQGENGVAGVLRISRLKDLASGRQVHVCTIEELEDLMRGLA